MFSYIVTSFVINTILRVGGFFLNQGTGNSENNHGPTLPGSDVSSYSTQDSSAPSSPHPMPHRLQHLSFRDQNRRDRGKLSRFYSQQESDPQFSGNEVLSLLVI